MKGHLLTLTLALSLGHQSIACDIDGKTGIVEDNDMWISVNSKSKSNVSEERFNEIISKIEAIYAPIVEEKGGKLQVERKWEDGTVNAYAMRRWDTWIVSMFGGLARHETVTEDGFALVVCHELGHHLGGTPKKWSWWGPNWATNEGQADYFGNLKCMRKYMENDDNIAIMKNIEVPKEVEDACARQFSLESEQAICKRGAMAGKSLAELFRSLRGMATEIRFDTPDSKVVTTTNHAHPAPQCRLDTYYQGALCDVDHNEEVDDEDRLQGTCNRETEDVLGVRPLCWYHPTK